MAQKKRHTNTILGILLLAALIAWDIHTHQVQTFFVGRATSQPPADEVLQSEGLPLLRPGTLTLGQGNPTVAIAAAIDAELPQPAAIDDSLSYEQVDAIVRRALDLDQSGRSIRDVIESDDWVVIKVNSVSNRGDMGSDGCGSRWTHDCTEHPGQITDLRVAKSVINYLIEHVEPQRITIAEGGSGSPRKDKPGFPSYAVDDSWSATYPMFADLSYMKILQEFAAMGTSTAVDTSDLNYAPFRRQPIPGGAISRLGVTRLTFAGAQYGFHIDGSGNFRSEDEGYFVPETILDADKVISIPAMKTTIYGTTLGIKNYVGTLAPLAYGSGLSKAAHYEGNPEQGYVDLFSYNPAAYTVIEGFWSTEGDGPQRGDNVQHNLVVVGSDPVATEAIANITMGYNPLDLEVHHLAAVKGFGTFDREQIRVVGRPPESVQHNFVKSKAVRASSGETLYYGRGIRRWLAAGPFPTNDIELEHLPGEEQLRPGEGQAAGQHIWTRVEHLGYSAERLLLNEIFGRDADVVNYAFTLVRSERQQEGYLWFGYNNMAKVWLNGEVIFADPERRNFALADLKIPITLQQGENRLLCKIGNVSGNTAMAAHVVDEDGDRLPGIEFILTTEAPTAIAAETATTLPGTPELTGNYPNPFNPTTHIRFALPRAASVQLTVYNSAGQKINTLVEETLAAGHYEAIWDGRNYAGYNAASGVYFAVLESANWRQTHSMVLAR